MTLQRSNFLQVWETPNMGTTFINNVADGGGGGGTTVYVEHDFTATTTGTLATVDPTTDELAGGWIADASLFAFNSDNSGVDCTSSAGNKLALVQTDGREDVQITCHFTASEGNTLVVDYQGIYIRSTGTSSANGLSMLLMEDTGNTDLNIALRDGRTIDTLLNNFDLSALMTTAPATGDAIEMVVRCSGNDITLYSMRLNGGSVEVINSTYTLTGAVATTHGSGSGADRYGIFSSTRNASDAERFEYFKVESIPS